MGDTVKLFDFVNDLSFGKKYLFSEDTRSKYDPFMINRAMAQHIDTIFFANEMNKCPEIDKLLHHDFYFYLVPPKKRYGKWAKRQKDDEIIELIIRHYKVNRTHAHQYLELMSDEDIKKLKQTYDVGGFKK